MISAFDISIAVALWYTVRTARVLHARIYNGPESSFAAIEFAPLNSPFKVKPGEFVELRTWFDVSQ